MSAREIPDGARATVLDLPDFRLDVTLDGDTLRTAVRSHRRTRARVTPGGYASPVEAHGDWPEHLRGARHDLHVTVGRETTHVILYGLTDRHRGVTQVTAHACAKSP
jgi:hypothetical protein